MFDVHCHLENEDYDKDLNEVVEALKKELKGVISCATHPKHFEKGLAIAQRHNGFVFLSAGAHPLHIKEISVEQRKELFEKIKKHAGSIVSIGEAGMDFLVEEPEFRELQEKYFREDINFARSLDKPVTVHSRGAENETARILEEEGYERIHWHLFKTKPLVPAVLKNGWMISVGPLLLKSKTISKIVRDVPLEQLLLETDSPWFGLQIEDLKHSESPTFRDGQDAEGKPLRDTPLNIKPVAEKIAGIKKISFEEVWSACGRNTQKFFGLTI